MSKTSLTLLFVTPTEFMLRTEEGDEVDGLLGYSVELADDGHPLVIARGQGLEEGDRIDRQAERGPKHRADPIRVRMDVDQRLIGPGRAR